MPGIGRDIERKGLIIAAQFEQAAIRQHAGRMADDQLAHVEKLHIDLQPEKTPEVTTQHLGSGFQLVIVITVAVLEVLRAQQQAFLPDHFMHIHASSPASGFTSSARRMPV